MTRDRSRRDRLSLHALAAAVTVLMLGPLARPGYVLRYDMVFTPRQPLRWDLIASSDTLPRAVPQDAVVSLLNVAAPGWLLQRVALVAVIWAATVGAGRLVPAERRLTRLVAAVAYAWTPFLAERLLLGQWGLLLAYAALPWLVAALLDLRAGRPGALPRLVLAAAPAAITPTGGVIALATVAVFAVGRITRWSAPAAVAALNLPWVAAALATNAGGRSDPAAVAVFAARAENWAGPYVALAGTGGIWNSRTTPLSRGADLIPFVTLGLLILAMVGLPRLRHRWGTGVATRFGALAAGSFLLSAAGTLPGGGPVLRWLVAEVPGAGLLRDGQKFLIPYALGLALAVALGVERLAGRLAAPRDRLVLVGALLLPLAVLPDLVFGGSGRLRPVSYPDDWRVVAALIAERPGPVLSAPMTAYRSLPWNPGTVVIDPLPRFVDADVVVDDRLRVGPVVVAGENPRVARVRERIAAGRPLAGTDLRWVVVQHGSGEPMAPTVTAGLRPVHAGPVLTLYENPAPVIADRPDPHPGRWVAGLGLLVAFGVLLAATAARIAGLWRRPTAW